MGFWNCNYSGDTRFLFTTGQVKFKLFYSHENSFSLCLNSLLKDPSSLLPRQGFQLRCKTFKTRPQCFMVPGIPTGSAVWREQWLIMLAGQPVSQLQRILGWRSLFIWVVARQRVTLFTARWEYVRYIYLLRSVRAGHCESLWQHAAQGLKTCTSFNVIPGSRIRAVCTRHKVILIFLRYDCMPFVSHEKVQQSSDSLLNNFF